MDNRKTLRSGVPRQLAEELVGLAPRLITLDAARYRLEQVVGRGSLFVTFRATRIDAAGAVPHAVKVLRPSLVRAWPAGARVLSREQARVLAILNERVPPSPHVVRLLEIGELDAEGLTVPFFALEWVDDEAPSLFERVRGAVATTGVAFDPPAALAVLGGVARGLDWVHQHGLLHRGLAPTNVLVTGPDTALVAKVSDVSIARPTGLPASFGLPADIAARSTEPYRAPEQQDARAQLTPACDVFALGALARFVLTGRPLAHGGALAGSDALSPWFRGPALTELDAALATLTTFDPDERPPTIQSAWELLEGPLRELSAATHVERAPPEESSPSTLVWTERHRPDAPLALDAIALDPEGRALAIADGGRGLLYFDGRGYRAPAPCAGLSVITALAAAATGIFLVGGRNTRGEARLFRLDASGFTRLPLDASGEVRLVLHDHDDWRAFVRTGARVAMVDLRGRVELPGLRDVTIAVRLGRALLVAGDGGCFTLDPESRVARPHRLPIRTIVAAARGPRELYLAGDGETLLRLAPVEGAAHRTSIAQEHTPPGATTLSVGPDRGLYIATGSDLWARDRTGTRVLFKEEGAAPCVALGVFRHGLLLFRRDGRVVEGRALGLT